VARLSHTESVMVMSNALNNVLLPNYGDLPYSEQIGLFGSHDVEPIEQQLSEQELLEIKQFDINLMKSTIYHIEQWEKNQHSLKSQSDFSNNEPFLQGVHPPENQENVKKSPENSLPNELNSSDTTSQINVLDSLLGSLGKNPIAVPNAQTVPIGDYMVPSKFIAATPSQKTKLTTVDSLVTSFGSEAYKVSIKRKKTKQSIMAEASVNDSLPLQEWKYLNDLSPFFSFTSNPNSEGQIFVNHLHDGSPLGIIEAGAVTFTSDNTPKPFLIRKRYPLKLLFAHYLCGGIGSDHIDMLADRYDLQISDYIPEGCFIPGINKWHINPSHPDIAARVIFNDKFRHTDGSFTVRKKDNQLFIWEENKYRPVQSNSELGISTFLSNHAVTGKPHIIKGVSYVACKSTSHFIDDILNVCGEIPGVQIFHRAAKKGWLGNDKPSCEMKDVLFGKTKNYNFVKRCEIPGSPNWFNLNTLSDDIDTERLDAVLGSRLSLDSLAPRWYQLLSQDMFPGCIKSQNLFEEYLGLCLSYITKFQKILQLIGKPRSGKGLSCNILRHIGNDLIYGTDAAALSGKNFTSSIVGKTGVCLTDARFTSKDIQQIIELLLQVSGGDSVTIEQKYKDAYSMKLDAKFILVANEMPQFPDYTGAMPSRMIILQTKNSYLGQEDIELPEKLKQESADILLRLVVALIRLLERGYFEEPESSKYAREEMEGEGNKPLMYLRQHVGFYKEKECSVDIIFEHYLKWCVEEGFRQQVDKRRFGKELTKYVQDGLPLDFKGKIKEQRRVGKGKSVFYRGIYLIDEAEAEQQTQERVKELIQSLETTPPLG